MPEPSAVRNKVIVRMLGHPLVLGPVIAGTSACLAAWALGARPGLGLFALVAGALGSLGTFITRLIVDDGRTARAVIEEIEAGQRQSQQAALDDLDRRLSSADRDPRPETALRDLRALMHAFDEFAQQASVTQLATVIEVRSKVQQLFEQSVHSLEQTLKLGETAQRLLSSAVRAPILEQRERLITDIEAGISQLGDTLATLQRLGAGGASHSELGRLREELDRSVAMANTVEARLQVLLNESLADARGEAKEPAVEQKG